MKLTRNPSTIHQTVQCQEAEEQHKLEEEKRTYLCLESRSEDRKIQV